MSDDDVISDVINRLTDERNHARKHLGRILAAWDATRSNLSSPFAPKYQDELREAIRSAREWVGTEVTP